MDKMMDNPWFLRIIALALAILLFVTVQAEIKTDNLNTNATSIGVIEDVPLEVYYDDESLVVTGAPKTVTVNIEGPSTIVASAKMMKDFKLFLDLRELTIGEHRVAIDNENFSDKLKVRTDPIYVNVVIEERITEEFAVEIDMNESLLAENYLVKSYEVEPKTVTITGAKSVIESIEFVRATIKGDQGINKSFEQQADVRVLDSDLNKLDVLVEPKTVQVKVKVEEYSKEVPVVLVEQGIPKKDVTINELSTDVETIRLYGSRSVLDKIDQLNVDVDVSKIENSGTFDVKLAVPEGVTKLSLDKIKVKTDVTIVTPPDQDEEEVIEDEKQETISGVTEKSFDQVKIAVKGLPERLVSIFNMPVDGVVSIVAKGTPEAIEKVQSTSFSVYVNAQSLEVGETVLPIQIEGPPNIEWVPSESEVKLTIKEA